MEDDNSYEKEQKRIHEGSLAAGYLGVLAFFIILSIICVALIATWCSIKSIIFYIKAVKVKIKKDSFFKYSFAKGLYDIRTTYLKYWDFVSDYFVECCNPRGYYYYYYAIGILMYPIGLLYSLIFVLFHLITLSLCVGIRAIFRQSKNENNSK